jgi:hypothetical protein
MLATLVSLLAFSAIHVTAEEQKPYVGSEAFERAKQLVGSWEGTMDMGKGPEKITASYRLTSGGSALVETVFEGADHEMVTVYHDNANRQLQLTHYCMLGNQPKMVLKGTKNNELTFDLSEDADIDVAHETHMHAVRITFNGADTMTQRWTEYKGGKASNGVEIVYRRVE